MSISKIMLLSAFALLPVQAIQAMQPRSANTAPYVSLPEFPMPTGATVEFHPPTQLKPSPHHTDSVFLETIHVQAQEKPMTFRHDDQKNVLAGLTVRDFPTAFTFLVENLKSAITNPSQSISMTTRSRYGHDVAVSGLDPAQAAQFRKHVDSMTAGAALFEVTKYECKVGDPVVERALRPRQGTIVGFENLTDTHTNKGLSNHDEMFETDKVTNYLVIYGDDVEPTAQQRSDFMVGHGQFDLLHDRVSIRSLITPAPPGMEPIFEAVRSIFERQLKASTELTDLLLPDGSTKKQLGKERIHFRSVPKGFEMLIRFDRDVTVAAVYSRSDWVYEIYASRDDLANGRQSVGLRESHWSEIKKRSSPGSAMCNLPEMSEMTIHVPCRDTMNSLTTVIERLGVLLDIVANDPSGRIIAEFNAFDWTELDASERACFFRRSGPVRNR